MKKIIEYPIDDMPELDKFIKKYIENENRNIKKNI